MGELLWLIGTKPSFLQMSFSAAKGLLGGGCSDESDSPIHVRKRRSRFIEDEAYEAGDTEVRRKSRRFPQGTLQVPTSGLLEVDSRFVKTISEIRGVFRNPLHKTCYLGSLLHCLLSLQSVAQICVQHAKEKKNCGNTCFLCLLQDAYHNTRSPEMMCTVDSWRMPLTMFGLDFDAQQDPVEVLQLIAFEQDVSFEYTITRRLMFDV